MSAALARYGSSNGLPPLPLHSPVMSLTPAELSAQSHRHRSPLVWRAVEDFLSGRRFPLQALTHCP